MNKQGENGIDWLIDDHIPGYTWGPIVGCEGPNGQPCPYCYARRLASRRMGEYGQHPVGEEFKPRFLPERLNEPLKLKRPSRIFAGSMTDFFGEAVDPEWLRRVWDTMWAAKQHTFVILTKRPDRMREWVRENASMRHFGWGDPEQHVPMRPGDLINMDELYHRERCGWANGAESYKCDHPQQDYTTEGEENCDDCGCPIAYPAYLEDIQEKDPLLNVADYEPCDGRAIGWVVLHSRPRYAFASNVWPGVSVTNQADADERIPWLARTPAAVRIVSYEPMIEPITFRSLDGMSWLILGAETGNRVGKVTPKREWVEAVVSQCRAAGVSVFMKSSLRDIWQGKLIQEYPGRGEVQP